MPRQPRLNLPGVFYHVMARGIERRTIFRNASDKLDFLRRLGEGLADTGCRCFAWALMSNHLHLLLLSGARGLVSLMQPLLTGYAVTFNNNYRRVGHLFQNRYKAIICQEDPYFLELVRYIGLQPVRAGLVRTPAELARYPWTSHRSLIGGPAEPWLEVDDVLGRFGSTRAKAITSYERFAVDGWHEGRRDDLEGGGLLRSVGGMAEALALRRLGKRQMADVRILGDGSFVEEILRQADARDETRQAIQGKWSPDDLRQRIADFAGVTVPALNAGNRRRSVVAARAMLVYAAQEWLGMTGATLSRWLGIGSGGVTKAHGRGRRLALEGKLFEHLEGSAGSNVP